MRRSLHRLIAWVLVLMFLPPLAGLPRASAEPSDPGRKITGELAGFHTADASAHVRFLVKLSVQADTALEAQRALLLGQGAEPRAAVTRVRSAVVQSLRTVAETTQTPVVRMLETLRAQGHVSAVEPLWVVNALVVTGDQTAVQRIAARSDVSLLQADRKVKFVPPAAEANLLPAAAGTLWNLETVKAPQTWGMGVTGTGVVVASLDTGVDWTHSALQKSFRGYNPASPNAPVTAGNWLDVTPAAGAVPYDDHGHGTHTVGTMVGYDPATGVRTGVAPGAKWIGVKAFTAEGAYDSWLLRAGQWLLAPTDASGVARPELAPDIINNSWGGEPGIDEFFRPMVNSWRVAGIVPVFAAGNEGELGPGSVSPPGNYPESYAVAAVDSLEYLAWFSSRGPSPYQGSLKPNISAPGVSILSTLPGGAYGSSSGTSMAAPHVAGIAALILSGAPDLAVGAVEQAMSESATPRTDSVYPVSPNYGYGAGLVNAYAAVSRVVPAGTVAGVVTNAATGAAMAATITLHPGGMRTESNSADGRYTLRAVAGSYDLVASAYGFESATHSVTLAQDQQTVLDVALTPLPRGTLRGKVTDGLTGLAIAGATVTILEDPRVAPAVSDAAGDYSLVAIARTYTVKASHLGYETVRTSAAVPAGGELVLNIELLQSAERPDDWPQHGGGPGHAGYNDSLLRPPLQKVWTSAVTPVTGSGISKPIVVAGKVFVGSQRTVHALDLETGSTLWQQSIGGYYTATGPSFLDGKVIIANSSAELFAFDPASGQQVWRIQLPGQYSSNYAPAVSGDRIFVAAQGSGSTLYAVSKSGSVLWTASLWAGTPAVGEGLVFAAGYGRASAYDQATGVRKWEFTGLGNTSYELHPVYADGVVLINTGSASSGGTLYGLEASTGRQLWQLPEAAGNPAVWEGIVYAPQSDGRVAKVRMRDGFHLGALNTPGGNLNEPVVANGVLYVGALTAIDLQSGQVLYSRAGTSGSAFIPPVVARDRVLTLDGGYLSSLGPESVPERTDLTGLVRDGATGALLPGAKVRLRGTWRTATAGDTGQYVLSATPGSYTIEASAYGYLANEQAVTLPAADPADFSLQPAQRGVVTGAVTDQLTGLPVRGATIVALEDPMAPVVQSGEQGEFRLELFPGAYTLRVRAREYRGTDVAVTIAASGHTEASIALLPYRSRPDDWVTQFGPPDHSGQTDNMLAPPLAEQWRTSGFQVISARPVVGDGRIFLAADDGMLRAYALENGQLEWKQAGGLSGVSPAYDRDKVYVTNGSGRVSAFDAVTGKPLWSVALSQWSTWSSPTATGGRVYVMGAGSGATLFALDGETGGLLWSQPVEGTVSSPAVAGGVVYLSGCCPRTYAFEAATGKLLWSHRANTNSGGGGQTPVIGAGLVLLKDFWSTDLFALDQQTGQLRWRRSNMTGVPAIVDAVIFAQTTGGLTEALSPATGAVLYTLPLAGPYAGANGYLYTGGVAAVHLATRTVTAAALPGGTGVAVAEERVLAMDENRNLVVLGPVNPVPPSGLISGLVLGHGTPPQPLVAEVRAADRTILTDKETGAYVLRVPAGTHTLTASAPRWIQGQQTIHVGANEEVGATLVLEPEPKGVVEGTVTDALTGLPVPRVRISIASDTTIPAVAGSDQGTYQIRLFEGAYLLRAEAPGYRIATVQVTVARSTTTVQHFSLSPGVAGGCPVDRCNPGRTGDSGRVTYENYAPAWRSDVFPRLNSGYSQPVIARSRVFVGSHNRELVALDLHTGRRIWTRDVGTPNAWPPGTPAYGDGMVFVGNLNYSVYALAEDTGEIVWKFTQSQWASVTPPVYLEGKVYVGVSGTGTTVYALDAKDGRKLWSQTVDTRRLAVGGERVYAVGYGPQVWAMDAATGKILWVSPKPSGSGYSDMALTYADEVVLAGPDAGSTAPAIQAYDAATGALLWQAPGTPPAVRDGTVYTTASGAVRALNLKTGTELWSVAVASIQPSSLAPVLAGDHLVLPTGTLIRLSTRTVETSLATGAHLSPVAGEGFVLLTASDGALTAVRGTPVPALWVAARVEHRTNHSGIQVTVQGGGLQQNRTTGPEGFVPFENLPAGTYTLTMSRGLYLRRVSTLSVPAGESIAGPFMMLAGDVNQDGSVTVSDLQPILARWHTSDPAADLTGDGRVNLRDLAALARNVGRTVEE